MPKEDQQFKLFRCLRTLRVEQTHRLKVLPQAGLPFRHVVFIVDGVDQREAGAAGPVQNFHFRLVVGTERHRPVNHVNNAGPGDNRSQQCALIVKARVVAMRVDKVAYRPGPAGRVGSVRAQPFQNRTRPLYAGRIHQRVQGLAIDAHRKFPRFARGARTRLNPHGIVSRERCHDARLAFVGTPHHRKNRQAHEITTGFSSCTSTV